MNECKQLSTRIWDVRRMVSDLHQFMASARAAYEQIVAVESSSRHNALSHYASSEQLKSIESEIFFIAVITIQPV